MVVREFDLECDYAAAVELWKSAGPGVQLSASDSRGELAKKLARDPDLFLVAEEAGRLVGTVIGGFDGRRGMVYHLAVATDQRGRGIGSQLMAEVEKRLQAKGCRRCYLMVLPENNAAQAFYNRRGWEIMRVILMVKDLTAP